MRTMRRVALLCAIGLTLASSASAIGTDAGVDIVNTATANFTIGGSPVTQDSNPETIRVAEILDVQVTLLTVTPNPNNEVTVAPSDTNQVLTFSITNTGNGPDTYDLTVLNGPNYNGSGNDTFDPTFVDIYFDDGTTPGVYDAGDTRYDPAVDDPTIAADTSITMHVLNNIDPGTVDGDLGDSQFTATSTAITLFPPASVAGDSVAGQGELGGDLVLGTSVGTGSEYGTYLVSTLGFDFQKSSSVTNPLGGTSPIPGATVTYTLLVEITGTGTATGVVITDNVPDNMTYVSPSIRVNGTLQTDAVDSPAVDDSDFDPVGGPTNNGAVTVDLGDLSTASGQQTITFQATID